MSEAAVADIEGEDEAPRTRLPTSPGDIVAEKYEVERTLGTGGMGVVVAAVHLDLQERVAIKFMLPEVAMVPAAANRFLREAQATSRLKSEHVARLHDVGKLADGTPFMVMELLDGESLDRLLQREVQVDTTRLVDIVLQACEPLDEAHRIGIVHRDVKPENIFLARRVDEGPIVKVLDFGISKVQTSITITVSNGMMGTASYSSPEQLKNASEVGPSADVWSLGVILYEGLTGKLPFGGTSYPEICASVLHDEPPRARFHRHDLPEELDDVVLRCVLKDAKDRITSIPELAAALAPFASEEGRALAARIVRRSSKRPDGRPGSIPPGTPSQPSQRTPVPFTVTPLPPSEDGVASGAGGGATMDLERHLLAVPPPLHEGGWNVRRVLRSKLAVGLGGFAIVLTMTAVLGGLPGDDPSTPAAQAASAVRPPKVEAPPVEGTPQIDEPSIPSPPPSASEAAEAAEAPTSSARSARAEKPRARVPGPLPTAPILPPSQRNATAPPAGGKPAAEGKAPAAGDGNGAGGSSPSVPTPVESAPPAAPGGPGGSVAPGGSGSPGSSSPAAGSGPPGSSGSGAGTAPRGAGGPSLGIFPVYP